MTRVPALLLACAATAIAYIPGYTDLPLLRNDFANIQFLANQSIAAGMTTAAGTVWITPDSAPMDAFNGAIGAWNGVSTTAARFLPIQPTSLSYNAQDGNDVIVFVDDPYTESFTNGIVAITQTAYFSNGTIFDTDIFFSTFVQFSTTLAPGTYDIQSVVTHELGHALGANHTNILSATMWYTTAQQDPSKQILGADDMAFVSAVYPPAAGNGYGTISGVITVSGSPLQGGAITAVDPNTGITVGGFSSVIDGSFAFQVPPGNYFVYVEPAVNLNLYDANSIAPPVLNTAFQSAFAGGNTQPSLIPVQAGATAPVNIDATGGTSPLTTPLFATSIAGGTGDYHGTFNGQSITISSGQSVDILFTDPLPGAITASNIQILGPATLRAGSLHRDTISLTDGTPIYRFTLDIPPLTASSAVSLVFASGANIVTRSGLLNLTRPQSVNAASFLGGPVAPGEILSFFGSQLGPASPVSNGGFDANGQLPVSLGNIAIKFDGTAAPLFYASNSQVNLQVPYEISGKAFTVMTVFYNGSTVATTTLTVAKSAPGVFVVTNADGSANGPSSPGSVGGILVIYGTGAGITSGAARTGAATPANSTIPATVTIGGAPVTPIFSGLTAGSVGLTQVNVAIPAGTPSGDAIPLQFSMNGVSSQTVNISVH